MELEDFLNRHVIIELKDGEIIDGIIMEINDFDDDIDSIYYTTINVRLDLNEYRIVYLTEIDNIGLVE